MPPSWDCGPYSERLPVSNPAAHWVCASTGGMQDASRQIAATVVVVVITARVVVVARVVVGAHFHAGRQFPVPAFAMAGTSSVMAIASATKQAQMRMDCPPRMG